MAEPKDQDEERRKKERERDRARNRSGPRPPPKAQAGPKGQAAQDVPQEVEELITAVAAEAQPQLEQAQPSGSQAGIPNPVALPAFGASLRGVALEVIRLSAAAAGQSLKDYVAANRDDLLARLPRVLVTLMSALREP